MKKIIATGRCTAGLWRIQTSEGMTYIIEVFRGEQWEQVQRAGNSYDAHACYNQLAEAPRRIVRLSGAGAEVIRTSDEDGYAATWAARTQEAAE